MSNAVKSNFKVGFHITQSSNLESIFAHGLEPRVGYNSRRVYETKEAVHFTPSLHLVNSWKELLYPDNSWKDLTLLRIDLSNNETFNIKYNNQNAYDEDYTVSNISPQDITKIDKICLPKLKIKIPLKFSSLVKYTGHCNFNEIEI